MLDACSVALLGFFGCVSRFCWIHPTWAARIKALLSLFDMLRFLKCSVATRSIAVTWSQNYVTLHGPRCGPWHADAQQMMHSKNATFPLEICTKPRRFKLVQSASFFGGFRRYAHCQRLPRYMGLCVPCQLECKLVAMLARVTRMSELHLM